MLAIILVDHGSRRTEANENLLAIAATMERDSPYAIVEPAHMELAEPTVADAFERAIARGATRIVVHPYFLAPGRHSTEDIPELCANAAAAHPGLAWTVTEPLGLSRKLVEVISERVESAIRDEASWRES